MSVGEDLGADGHAEVVADTRLVVVGRLGVVHALRILAARRVRVLAALRWRRRVLVARVERIGAHWRLLLRLGLLESRAA